MFKTGKSEFWLVNPRISGLPAWLIPCLLLILSPDCLEACGLCVFAAWDRVLPPVSLWMLWMAIWFLALGAIASRSPQGLSGTWGLMGSLLALAPVVVFSALLGPIPFMILMLRPLKIFWLARRPACREQWGEPACSHIRRVGLTGLAGLVALGMLSAVIRSERPLADWILKWQNTGPALGQVRMIERGAESVSVEQLRKLIRQGSPAIAADVAKPLAETGTATEDVPLLIDALANCRARSTPSEQDALKVETALRSMTGLSLATGTSVEEWRNRWAAIR